MELSNEILSSITIHMKYAKWSEKLKRRETWEEIVDRNKAMHIKRFPKLKTEINDAYKYVYDKKVFPSMRSMQFAGKPIELSPNRIFNCAYLPVDDWHAFGEIMFLLLGGSGIGFSVQKHHIEKLPVIRKPNPDNIKRYLIADSIEGWADAIKMLMKSYFYGGATLKFDYSDIREKGARLVTSGGRAPGAEPLHQCIKKIKALLDSKNDNENLHSYEVHDIVCHIADAVLAGGIRRAALISLFSANDNEMMKVKTNFNILNWEFLLTDGPMNSIGEPVKIKATHSDNSGQLYYDLKVLVNEPGYGESTKELSWVSEKELEQLKNEKTLPWYLFQSHRGRANNTITLVRSKINKKKFFDLWEIIKLSQAGEPGFYFTNDKDWGFNPCAEASLRPYQFCNLCEVNVSDLESQEDLNDRVKAAAFIGTLQASYTDFHYLRPIWKKTTERDALLGVGMTGIGSGVVLKYDMKQAAEQVKKENERVAKIIGIKKAARCTVIKPAGTVSCVAGTSSGIHAWHNDYYIRRIRVGKNEAIYSYLQKYHNELLEDDYFRPFDTAIISVPQKAPIGSILRNESAISLLERIKLVKSTWIDGGHRDGMNTHNVSATVSVKENEWEEVGQWLWDNKEYYTAISVLPYDSGTYKQAPFQDCSEQVYSKMMSSLNEIDLTKIKEDNDETETNLELACSGGSCSI